MSEEIVDFCQTDLENLSNDFRTISMENIGCNNEICKGDSPFDEIIGHIEDLLIEDEFQRVQQTFLDKYWKVFEPMDENKLIYMDIFQEYNNTIESYIERSLTKLMPLFSMESFLNRLGEKNSELDGEVFEVLSTFTDFVAFKEMFLDYRAVKEGKVQDLSGGISITSVNSNNCSTTTAG